MRLERGPRRLRAGCAGLCLSIAFYHAWETEGGRCLLTESCDWRVDWRTDEALQWRWERLWIAASGGAVMLPFVSGWRRQLLVQRLRLARVPAAVAAAAPAANLAGRHFPTVIL